MSKQLTKWIEGLSREKLEDIVYELSDHLLDGDTLRFNPDDEDLPDGPYWGSCGIEIGEDE